MDENAQAKKGFSDALFNELEQKVAFIDELARGGHRDEAMLLCCVYLDGFANQLKGRENQSSARTFCDVLTGHGGEPALSLLTLSHLEDRIKWPSVAKQFRDKLRSALEALPSGEALNATELARRSFRESQPLPGIGSKRTCGSCPLLMSRTLTFGAPTFMN